jgi:hypothetical protein
MNFRYTIIALWLIWLVYWIVSAFGNKRTAQTSRVWRIMALLVLFGVFALWQNFPAFFDQRFLPRTFAGALTGTILCALGIAFSIWARAILGRNWSSNPSIKEGHELVHSGPYRFARHPIYKRQIRRHHAVPDDRSHVCHKAADRRIADAAAIRRTIHRVSETHESAYSLRSLIKGPSAGFGCLKWVQMLKLADSKHLSCVDPKHLPA